jgi:type III pantothenate kinase
MSRILTADIGNSNIVVGSWNGEELEFTKRIVTRRDYACEELTNELSAFLDSSLTYDGSVLASVVPEITDQTADALEMITQKRPLIMGPFLRTGVDVSGYKGKIGMDRIVDMAAAVSSYGVPVMVCDLGTCTTITVADRSGNCNQAAIAGGLICPGVQLSLDAQAARASQLPQLYARDVDSLLGTDTDSNMLSGAVAGAGMMISELAKRLATGRTTLDDKTSQAAMPDLKVVLTGGLGKLVFPWIKSGIGSDTEIYYEPDLLLRGLKEIYYLNK